MNDSIIQGGLYLTYALLIIAVLGIVIGLILGMVQNPKSGIFTVGAVVVILIVFGIGYAMSDAPLTQKLITKGFTESHMKMFTGGIITFYVLFVAAWVVLALDLIKNLVQGNR